MRSRRGNYSLLFTLSATVLMGFAAYAVDIGRLRVARIQAQNAADAASVAALVRIRSGNLDGLAAAAGEVASETSLLGAAGSFTVGLNTGGWDWGLDAASAFTTGAGSNAVQVRVEPGAGVAMIFAPILPGAETSGSVSTNAWSAFRPRDIAVVVDTTSLFKENLFHTRRGVSDLLDVLDDFSQERDQVALFAYAGAATTVANLTPMTAAGYTALQAATNELQPCNIGDTEWLEYYRFTLGQAFDPDSEHWYTHLPFDPELIAGDPGLIWTYGSFEANIAQWLYGWNAPSAANWHTTVQDTDDQIALWEASRIVFHVLSPIVEAWGPIDCREGNFYVGRDDRFITEVGVDGVPDFGVVGETHFQDRSFARAGGNPGAGLALAADELTGGGIGAVSERVAILVAGAAPYCHEELGDEFVDDCVSAWEDEAVAAADRLEAAGVDTYVIAVLPDGSDDATFLSALVTGEGEYFQVANRWDVDDLIEDIARRPHIQVVR